MIVVDAVVCGHVELYCIIQRELYLFFRAYLNQAFGNNVSRSCLDTDCTRSENSNHKDVGHRSHWLTHLFLPSVKSKRRNCF